MDGSLLVRIRGTFIDIDFGQGPQDISQKRRSSSVPPNLSAQKELEFSGQEEYLAGWIENAKDLPQSRLAGQQVEPRKDGKECISGPQTPLKRRQERWCDQDVLYSELSSHALAFTEDASPTSTAFPHSESSDTLPSMGSCDPETTSTLDSESLLDRDHCSPFSVAAQAVPKTEWSGPAPVVAFMPSCEQTTLATSITTLMICDIPCRKTIDEIIDAINMHGLAGTFDLVYMPSRRGFGRHKHSQNMGYAFVNFKHPQCAAAFACVFHDYSFPNCYSAKLSYTKPAHFQGYHANLEVHSKERSPGCLLTFP